MESTKQSSQAATLTVITQAELESIVRDDERIGYRCADVRDRISAGASIEPGQYVVEVDGDNEAPRPSAGLYSCGLDISRH